MRSRALIGPSMMQASWSLHRDAERSFERALSLFRDASLIGERWGVDRPPSTKLRPALTRARPEDQEHRQHLEAQVKALRDEVAALRARVDRLTERSPMGAAVFAAPDPVDDWIHENQHQLRPLADELVAIHPTRGIVHHDADERAFGTWLAGLDQAEAADLLTGYGSTFLEW